jgi:DNA-binding NarL/FixJ family response regulator
MSTANGSIRLIDRANARGQAVAIVEDHRLLAETLALTLRERGVGTHVAELCEPADLLAQLLDLRPRLVVLDLDLGAFGDSTWLIEPLTADGIRVLVLTGSGNRLRIAAALEQGAIGYQHKSSGFEDLVTIIEQVASGNGVLDPEGHAALLAELSDARIERARRLEPFNRLTDRERDTLQALARGRTVADIAQSWVVSETTVRTHVRAILAKLKAPSQLTAVSMALRSGWLDPAARAPGRPPAEHPSRRATDLFPA